MSRYAIQHSRDLFWIIVGKDHQTQIHIHHPHLLAFSLIMFRSSAYYSGTEQLRRELREKKGVYKVYVVFEEQGERTWEKMKRRDRHIFSIKWTFGIGYLSLRMIRNSSYCNCWTPAPFEMRVSLDIHTATFSCPLLPNSDYVLSAVPWRLLFSDLFLNVVTFQSSTFHPFLSLPKQHFSAVCSHQWLQPLDDL